MGMDYEYDAFFSYKRDPQSDDWHYQVKEKLRFWLRQELNRDRVEVFFDTEDIRTGEVWRQRLGDALRESRCLVCIWSPLYFQSKWCVSEWRTFAAREQKYKANLVLPAKFHDGESFPATAQSKQMADFRSYTSIMARFWETEKAFEFEAPLRKFARDLAVLIRRAPPYDPEFPIEEAKDQDVAEEPPIGRIARG